MDLLVRPGSSSRGRDLGRVIGSLRKNCSGLVEPRNGGCRFFAVGYLYSLLFQ